VGIKRKALLLLSLGLFFLVLAGGICWSGTTERISLGPGGIEGNDASTDPSTSSDGMYVAFKSFATNLVTGGTSGKTHIFVRDRQTGITTLVSVDSAGAEGNGDSSAPSISGDGRYVAFVSDSDNLVGGDGNGFFDIFVRDLQSEKTIRVSVTSGGGESDGVSFNPSISADGRYAAFDSDGDLVAADTGNYYDIFVRDLSAGTTIRASVRSDGSEGNGHSYSPSISGDGRYVAFESFATDLVAEGTNGNGHIFVRDLLSGTNAIVSVNSGGDQGNGDSYAPSISADGRYVAFMSDATNLLGLGNDTNGWSDIFVHDLQTGATTRVSVDSSENQGNGNSNFPSISSHGRYVAFMSDASNLVGDDINGSSDVFVHDLQTGATTRVSVDSSENQGNGNSSAPAISANGQCVTFESDADNLVGGDGNGFFDIFVYQGDPLPSNTTQSEENNSSANISCFIATAASDWPEF
jgi:Tol biopolymer transport system component